MARSITRQTIKLFGTSGGTSNFAEFGSQAASAPVKTKSIPTIQSLSAWDNGWQDAVALNQAPYLEDMNAKMYVDSYAQCYLYQEGIAEWDSGTTYFIGSVVKSLANSGWTEFYVSLTDANTNHALPTRSTNTNWQFLYALQTSQGLLLPASITNFTVPTGNVGYINTGGTDYASRATVNTSGAWADLGTMLVTAGNWLLSCMLGLDPNGGTITSIKGGFGTVAGNNAPDTTKGQGWLECQMPGGTTDCSLTIANFFVSTNISIAYRAKISGTWSVAIPKGYSYMQAVQLP